ncbi:hypothetical protein Rhe02_35270 [Rhizocola hellebori]|uniref:Uncharacterized protein n=1 Tax=Rhizocola hellebori TaxID=1392758 RepID=A0A8J3Q7V5_9ACTN|nr:hypothetical protein Rhe02_35270 [Rhizocola hellebori]
MPADETAPPTVSVGLAVEDFVPTLLAFLGFVLLAPSVLGRLGAVLMGAGGAAKSTWKLLHAAWGMDVPWLDDLLFPLLAAGGLLLAVSLHRSLRWWSSPLVIAGALVAALAVVQRSVQPTFVFATVAVVWISILGTVRAAKHGSGLGAALFPVSILAVMALIPLRGHAASGSLAFQWVQQGMNTMAQAVFCIAAVLTYRAVRRSRTDQAQPDWPSSRDLRANLAREDARHRL